MTPEDQAAYAEIICNSFTETEIEHLEIYANQMFAYVEAGNTVTPTGPLVLDTLKKYERGEKNG